MAKKLELEVEVGKGREAEMVAWASLTSFLGRSGPRCWRTVSASPWGPERRGKTGFTHSSLVRSDCLGTSTPPVDLARQQSKLGHWEKVGRSSSDPSV